MVGYDKNGVELERGDTIRYKKESRVRMLSADGKRYDRRVNFEGCDITCIITGNHLSPTGDLSVWVTTDHPKYKSIKASAVEKISMSHKKEIEKLKF
jgi:hypothetical protein